MCATPYGSTHGATTDQVYASKGALRANVSASLNGKYGIFLTALARILGCVFLPGLVPSQCTYLWRFAHIYTCTRASVCVCEYAAPLTLDHNAARPVARVVNYFPSQPLLFTTFLPNHCVKGGGGSGRGARGGGVQYTTHDAPLPTGVLVDLFGHCRYACRPAIQLRVQLGSV